MTSLTRPVPFVVEHLQADEQALRGDAVQRLGLPHFALDRKPAPDPFAPRGWPRTPARTRDSAGHGIFCGCTDRLCRRRKSTRNDPRDVRAMTKVVAERRFTRTPQTVLLLRLLLLGSQLLRARLWRRRNARTVLAVHLDEVEVQVGDLRMVDDAVLGIARDPEMWMGPIDAGVDHRPRDADTSR